MSKLREMIDAIENDDFDEARVTLTASLAEYMAGKKYLSNKDVFGVGNVNPNEEEQELKSELGD